MMINLEEKELEMLIDVAKTFQHQQKMFINSAKSQGYPDSVIEKEEENFSELWDLIEKLSSWSKNKSKAKGSTGTVDPFELD